MPKIITKCDVCREPYDMLAGECPACLYHRPPLLVREIKVLRKWRKQATNQRWSAVEEYKKKREEETIRKDGLSTPCRSKLEAEPSLPGPDNRLKAGICPTKATPPTGTTNLSNQPAKYGDPVKLDGLWHHYKNSLDVKWPSVRRERTAEYYTKEARAERKRQGAIRGKIIRDGDTVLIEGGYDEYINAKSS